MTIPIKSNMQVQSGATLSATGTGAIDATETGGINVTGNSPSHAGQILISQPGNVSALWADPQVQGLYAAGSTISPAPAYVAPTDIQPVLMGGSDGTHLRNISTDSSGNVNVNVVSGTVTVSGTVAATQSGTQPVSGTVAVSSVSGSVAVTGTFFQATQPVSGTVAVSSVSGSVAVTGTFFQATQPVSGTVAVSSVSGSVAVTGTFFQATQPVSGTVAVTQSTSPWVVSNGGTFSVQPSTGGSSVYSHALNQDGSGNVGVNVENTVTVSGTISGSTVTNVTPGTYVANAGGSFSSSTTATQTITGVVGGDTIIVGFSYTSTSTISSVVDNLGNVYNQITTEVTAVNGLKFALYYTTGVFAGSTTVTVTFNMSTSGELAMVEYNGGVYLQTSTSSNGSAASFSTSTQGAAVRSNNMEVMFVYGQGGTLVPNNTSLTNAPGRSLTPRFTSSNYLIGECILNESYAPNFAFTQASSTGYAWLYAEFAIMNPTQVPLINTNYFGTPTAFVPIGGIDTAGNSVRAGVVSVQGVSSGGLWIATDIFKQVTVALTSTASGIGGPTGFALPIAGQYQITQPLLTTSNSNGIIQLDIRGNQLTTVGVQTTVGTAWSSGTAINTFQYLPGNTTEGALLGVPAVYIQLDQTTPFSAGAVTFQGTYDNVNWVTIPVAQVLNPNTFVQLSNPYTFVASTQQPFLILMQGYQNIRMNLTSTITGAGTVTPYWAAQSVLPPLPLDAMPSTVANAPSQQTVTSSSASVLAANNSRRELRVTNTGTVAVYLGLGQTPTATAYHVALAACTGANDGTGGSYTSDVWKGAVNAIVASTSGTVVVTELT